MRTSHLPAFLALCMTFPLAANPKRGIEYGRAGDVPLLLDAHIPPGEGPHPAVILVHGGAWISGDRERSVAPLFAPLEKAGIAWFSVSYRFVTDFMLLGTAIDDVQEAVRYVRQNSKTFRIDPNCLALIGESAGAQLASMAAARGVEDASSAVSAVVAFYSPSDLASLAQSSPLVPPRIREAVKGTLFADLLLSVLRTLSPMSNLRPDLPPFLLIHGTADTVVPYAQSEQFCERLKAVGGKCELLTVVGGGHGIREWRSPAQSHYRDEFIAWLQKQWASR